MKKILDQDQNHTEVFHKSHDGIVTIEKKNDVSAILKANKFQRDHQDARHKSEVFNHVARVDGVAAEAWCKTRGISPKEFLGNREHIKAFLNDPDNAVWRTRKGKI